MLIFPEQEDIKRYIPVEKPDPDETARKEAGKGTYEQYRFN